MSELEYLRSEYQRMRDLLDRRPALNEGLFEAYEEWTAEVYASDISFPFAPECDVIH